MRLPLVGLLHVDARRETCKGLDKGVVDLVGILERLVNGRRGDSGVDIFDDGLGDTVFERH